MTCETKGLSRKRGDSEIQNQFPVCHNDKTLGWRTEGWEIWILKNKGETSSPWATPSLSLLSEFIFLCCLLNLLALWKIIKKRDQPLKDRKTLMQTKEERLKKMLSNIFYKSKNVLEFVKMKIIGNRLIANSSLSIRPYKTYTSICTTSGF